MKKIYVVMMFGCWLLLSGCTGNLSKGWDAVKLSGHPIVKASGQFDSTLASVVAVAGPPKAKILFVMAVVFVMTMTSAVMVDHPLSMLLLTKII